MNVLDRISKTELKELLSKGWMTHDAMWFYHCAGEVGPAKAGALNLAAIKSMAPIEARRIGRAIGLETINSFADLKRFIIEGFELIRPEFMKFTYTFPEENLIHWETDDCFAHKGISRMGFIEEYECGIIKRITGWLDGMGVEYTTWPETGRCLFHTEGHCLRAIRTRLNPSDRQARPATGKDGF